MSKLASQVWKAGKSPNGFYNSHGLNQLSTDSYKMHGQHVDVWNSFRARLPPANLHQNNSIPLKLHIPTIPEKMMKRCISQSPWIAILEAKKPHRVFFAAAPKKRLCFFLELPRRIFRNAGRESGANPEGALPFQSHLVVFEYDKWTFGESIDVSSWWSFSKMYYVYIILYHIF